MKKIERQIENLTHTQNLCLSLYLGLTTKKVWSSSYNQRIPLLKLLVEQSSEKFEEMLEKAVPKIQAVKNPKINCTNYICKNYRTWWDQHVRYWVLEICDEKGFDKFGEAIGNIVKVSDCYSKQDAMDALQEAACGNFYADALN